MSKASSYLTEGRLADVLARIQVLALDPHPNRSESGLQQELQGPPRSSASWEAMASAHPEFFRVDLKGSHGISLVARYVLPKADDQPVVLPSDYAEKLLALAVDLHDRAVRRSQKWHVWLPVVSTIVGALLTLIGVLLKSTVLEHK